MRVSFVQFRQAVVMPDGKSYTSMDVTPRDGLHPDRYAPFALEWDGAERLLRVIGTRGAAEGKVRLVPGEALAAFDPLPAPVEGPKPGPGRGHKA